MLLERNSPGTVLPRAQVRSSLRYKWISFAYAKASSVTLLSHPKFHLYLVLLGIYYLQHCFLWLPFLLVWSDSSLPLSHHWYFSCCYFMWPLRDTQVPFKPVCVFPIYSLHVFATSRLSVLPSPATSHPNHDSEETLWNHIERAHTFSVIKNWGPITFL